jgi:hypothetical protein
MSTPTVETVTDGEFTFEVVTLSEDELARLQREDDSDSELQAWLAST